MTQTQIILVVITAVIIPLIVAEVRYRTRTAQRFSDVENFIMFLKAYLLKNAVLEFHSPDPRHQKTDEIIEKLVKDQELDADEIDTLVDRIKAEAHHAEDKKRRLQAASTLVIMDEFLEAVVTRKGPTALGELE